MDKNPVLVKFSKSQNPKKKMTAIFFNKDRKKIKTVHFGSKNMSDYTIHKNPERKQNYIKRHSAREDWNNPMTAGALSRFILWNLPTLSSSIKDYKKRFNLK